MEKKERQRIECGELPRKGYVYSLYRGHILRLGIVAAILTAILIWSLSGSWVEVKSYLFPSGDADLAAIHETSMQRVETDPQRSIFQPDRIETTGLWTQDGCYRLKLRIDAVEEEVLTLEEARVYLCSSGGYRFLVAAQTMPVTDTPYQAVFTAVPDQLAYDLRGFETHFTLPGYLADLRELPVGYEGSDSLQLIVFTPVVLAILIYWLLLLQKPQRHPIYRQLGRYGTRIDAVVASIDREVMAGEILEETRRTLRTPSWYLQRSAFMTTIYKNTAATMAEYEKGMNSNE